jgi:uncharacterized membrane protein YczE
VSPPRPQTSPPPHGRSLAHRAGRLVGGLALCGTGIAASVLAGLGLGPWDVLHQGIADRTGIAIGTANILVGVAILATWVPLRERPGVGTVANTVLIGLVINAWLLVVPAPEALAVRIVLMLAGLPVLAAGVGLYISAGMGPGPRDGVMTGLARRGHPVWLVRGAIEASALLTGWLLGGTVGIGTIVSVVGIGPLVHLSVDRFGALTPLPGIAGTADTAVPGEPPPGDPTPGFTTPDGTTRPDVTPDDGPAPQARCA